MAQHSNYEAGWSRAKCIGLGKKHRSKDVFGPPGNNIIKKKILFLILFRITPKISVIMTGKFLIPIKYRNCYFFSVS